MKMIFITYYEAVDDEVMAVLSDTGAETYTKWTEIKGKGGASGPHLGSHVWPKENNALAVCVEDEQAPELMDGIRKLRDKMRHEGIKAFQLPVEDVTG